MKNLLLSGCGKMGVDLAQETADKYIKYMNLLVEWNDKVNLTAITEEQKIITLHFLDSITPVAKKLINKGDNVIDIGCGAGFPGLPIKFAEDGINLTLLDALAKRLKFIEEVLKETDTQATLVHSRAEDGARDKKHREKYDVAVSRAVANMAVLCEYCLPYVKVGGKFIALKGPSVEEELKTSAIKVLGGELEQVIDVEIPFEDLSHKIVVVKKVKPTPPQYPRKAGTPSKKPIV